MEFGHQRPLWDFSENDNYVPYNIIYHEKNEPERFVYVKNITDTSKRDLHGRILCFLDVFTTHVQKYIKSHKHLYHNKCLRLFCHTNHTFYELHRNTAFNGVNKPTKVHLCKHANDAIGVDHKLRSHSRNVMIVIHDNVTDLYNLYCHEIAHTLCNHVRFRKDDHHGNTDVDFPHNEKLFKSIVDELNFREQLNRIFVTDQKIVPSI